KKQRFGLLPVVTAAFNSLADPMLVIHPDTTPSLTDKNGDSGLRIIFANNAARILFKQGLKPRDDLYGLSIQAVIPNFNKSTLNHFVGNCNATEPRASHGADSPAAMPMSKVMQACSLGNHSEPFRALVSVSKLTPDAIEFSNKSDAGCSAEVDKKLSGTPWVVTLKKLDHRKKDPVNSRYKSEFEGKSGFQ
ncbi:hypothetical protein HK405_004965, partial [Cladochytrium tenue]